MASQDKRTFISYRRTDTAPYAGWLHDRLIEQFGASRIFKDVEWSGRGWHPASSPLPIRAATSGAWYGGMVMTDVYDAASLEAAITVDAPDGSVVRPLCRITGAGSFAHFQLRPGEVSKAVSHRTVQEIWYVVAGAGEMWRRQQGRESVVPLRPGVCLTIPLGTAFQFRAAEGGQPLEAVAVTMPPWPDDGGGEAVPEDGPWRPTPT